MTVAVEPMPGGDRVRHVRWGPVCGLITFLYVMAVAVDRTALATDGSTYNDVHGRLSGPVARIAMAVVTVAALFHLLDGVRRLLRPGDPDPDTSIVPPDRAGEVVTQGAWETYDARARSMIAFVMGALGVPLVVAVLWPWLGGLG